MGVVYPVLTAMKKFIICLWGIAAIGKTGTICCVWDKLNKDGIAPLHQQGTDICGILPYENLSIGIASQGDPNSKQTEWIEELVSKSCDIIVCASRSRVIQSMR